jgi:hypothetical protein
VTAVARQALSRLDRLAWQGAGWFLMTVMLLVLTMSMPFVAGPALLGRVVGSRACSTCDVRFPHNGFG